MNAGNPPDGLRMVFELVDQQLAPRNKIGWYAGKQDLCISIKSRSCWKGATSVFPFQNRDML